MRPPRLLIVGALVALVVLPACGKTPTPDVAATVNGDVITNAEVQQIEPAYRMLVATNNQSCAPTTGSQSPPPTANCDRYVLTELIQMELVGQWAKAHGIQATETDVNAFIDQVQNKFGGLDKLNATMAQAGVSLNGLRQLGHMGVFLQNTQTEFDKVAPDSQLQQIYDANKAKFATIDTAHILVSSLAQAQQIKAEVNTSNFADLAKKYSIDTGSARNGGDIGSVSASQLVPQYSAAVLAAQPGQIIGPVQSQFGYHIIWVKNITYQPFDSVKDQLRQQAFGYWMAGLMGKSDIQVNPRYGRLDTKSGQIVPVTSTAATPSP